MKLYDVIRNDQQKDQAKKGAAENEPMVVETSNFSEEQVTFPTEHRRRRRHIHQPLSSWRKIVLIGGIVVFFTLLYLVSILFVHARVVINERQIPFSLQNTQIDLTNSTVADPGRLSFQTMVVTDTVSRQVFGSATTTSTTKAMGVAVIFNQYSKSSQTVRSGTTLTGANGKKYITQSSVTVPGFTGKGTTLTPGSAKVSIVAADIGPLYNSDGTTFTIAGWTGATAKNFFASSAGAITGGQNGAMHTLSDADKQQALATLQGALREKLTRETRAQIPDNLVTFPDLQFTTLDANSLNITGSTIQFAASLQGTMVSYLIPRDLLEQAIAAKAINDHLYPSVNIPALGDIQVEPVSALPTDPKNIPQDITVSVSGQGVIITQVSPAAIQQAVAGIRRRDFGTILSAIPEIDSAHYTLLPFWASYFPYKQSRIKVEIQ